jgi:oligosaccharide repeat unit polymerase
MQIFLWVPWYVFLFLIAFTFHRLTNCFTKINIFTIFLLTFLLNHGFFVPINFFINDQVNDFKLPDITKIRWLVSLALMYIFFIVGLLIAKTRDLIPLDANLPSPKERINSLLKGVVIKPTFEIVVVLLCIFTVAALWQPSLIFDTLAGGLTAEDYKTARVGYGEQFSSQTSIVSRIALTIKLGLLPMFTYMYFLLRKYSYRLNTIFIFVLMSNLLLGLMSGQKAGLSQTILGLTIVNSISKGNNYLRSKSILILVWIILAIFFIIAPLQYSIQYPELDYLEILELLQYRMGGETTRTLQLYFYVYPDIFPHLLGLSSSIVSGLFGMSEILDPSRVVRSYIAFGTTTDATGSWNAAFIGTAWADFGFIGVAIESALVTMLLSYYHKWFLLNKTNPIVIGTYVSLAFSSMNVAEGNLLTALLTGGLGLTFLFVKLFGDSIYAPKTSIE